MPPIRSRASASSQHLLAQAAYRRHRDSRHFEALKTEVAHVVHVVLQRFAENFDDKHQYLIGAPAIMAGIGVTAHRTIRTLPHRSMDEVPVKSMSVDELIDLLADIRWDKEDGTWDGIATTKTPKGVTTVAGPKEVGYAVAEAIDGSNAVTAAQIRGRKAEQLSASPAEQSHELSWPVPAPSEVFSPVR